MFGGVELHNQENTRDAGKTRRAANVDLKQVYGHKQLELFSSLAACRKFIQQAKITMAAWLIKRTERWNQLRHILTCKLLRKIHGDPDISPKLGFLVIFFSVQDSLILGMQVNQC